MGRIIGQYQYQPKIWRKIDSPLEYGYGNRHTAAIKAMKIEIKIAIPQRTNDGGISPISCLTFSERSSLLL